MLLLLLVLVVVVMVEVEVEVVVERCRPRRRRPCCTYAPRRAAFTCPLNAFDGSTVYRPRATPVVVLSTPRIATVRSSSSVMRSCSAIWLHSDVQMSTAPSSAAIAALTRPMSLAMAVSKSACCAAPRAIESVALAALALATSSSTWARARAEGLSHRSATSVHWPRARRMARMCVVSSDGWRVDMSHSQKRTSSAFSLGRSRRKPSSASSSSLGEIERGQLTNTLASPTWSALTGLRPPLAPNRTCSQGERPPDSATVAAARSCST